MPPITRPAQRRAAASEEPNHTEPSRGPQVSWGTAGLVLSWSGFRVPLEHYHYDTFQAKAKGPGGDRLADELATFALDGRARVARLRFLGRTFRRAE